MAFKRMTTAQRECYAALRQLGYMVIQPQDARPVAALKARGLVRYRRIDGVKHAVLKGDNEQKPEARRMHNVPRPHWGLVWPNMPKTGRIV